MNMTEKTFIFLKERAREFWDEAAKLKAEGKFNLAAFHIEQAAQLWMKYLIGRKVGDFPKTHYFNELVSGFAKAYDDKSILEFYKERELFFDNLEDAYFTSRYYPRTFTANSVEQLLNYAQDFIQVTEKITGEKI